MGGSGDAWPRSRVDFSKVEILDTTKPVQRYQAASLPHPHDQVSFAAIGNTCYLLGGLSKQTIPKKVLCVCVCLDDLISQVVSQGSPSAIAPQTQSPW